MVKTASFIDVSSFFLAVAVAHRSFRTVEKDDGLAGS